MIIYIFFLIMVIIIYISLYNNIYFPSSNLDFNILYCIYYYIFFIT